MAAAELAHGLAVVAASGLPVAEQLAEGAGAEEPAVEIGHHALEGGLALGGVDLVDETDRIPPGANARIEHPSVLAGVGGGLVGPHHLSDQAQTLGGALRLWGGHL